MVEMTLNEAIKKRKILKDQILKIVEEITRYATKVNFEKSPFESDEAQKREVASRVQSAKDLIKELMCLEKNITYTNLMTIVTIDDNEYSIYDLLLFRGRPVKDRSGRVTEFRESYSASFSEVYSALNDGMSIGRLRNFQPIDGKPAQVERFYDEKSKLEEIQKIELLRYNIKMKLETINNTTMLIQKFQPGDISI